MTTSSLHPKDIQQCLALLLGQSTPHVPARLADTVSTLPALIALVLDSSEFKEQVLKPVLLRKPWPDGRFKDELALSWIHWAQTYLPISDTTRVRIGCARQWHTFHEALLADESLVKLSASLTEANVHRVLEERVSRDATFKFEHAIAGALDEASTFDVSGWALDTCQPDTPLKVHLYADGVRIASTLCDLPRPDVIELVGGTGQIGFMFQISAAHRKAFAGGCKLLVRDDLRNMQIGKAIDVHQDAGHVWDSISGTQLELAQLRHAIARIEAQLPDLRRMASLPLQAYDEYWLRFYCPTEDQHAEQIIAIQQWVYQPLISVVMPSYNSSLQLLNEAIDSVKAQSYPHWELVISDDASPDTSFIDILERRHAPDARIRWVRNVAHGGIAGATNAGLAACQGEYTAFMDHDDLLAPDAMFHMVAAMQSQRPSILYSDEDRVQLDHAGILRHHSPALKPAFDPDLLLSLNYICHWVVVRSDLLAKVGGLRQGCEGAQDHELLLRLSRACPHQEIVHIPRVLYHWRVTPGSVSQSVDKQKALGYTIVEVVDQHLRALKQDAMVSVHEDVLSRPRLFATKIRWRLPAKAPKVSIIIPTRDGLNLLKPCVDSVLANTQHYAGPTELIIVDNDSTDPATLAYFESLSKDKRVRVLPYKGKFNYSAINNMAAREATGDVLIFLNNDTQVISPDWCAELVSHALRPEVGAVGARLLYEDNTLQHGGVVLGVEGLAGHEGMGESLLYGGYCGRSQVMHGASAVTAACLATRRDVFLQLDGGFEEISLQVAFNDVDYCLRVREAGLRVIYTPFATLHHFESKSRGRELTLEKQARFHQESLTLGQRWGDLRVTDPFYNPHFERHALAFSRLCPPPSAQARVSAAPERFDRMPHRNEAR